MILVDGITKYPAEMTKGLPGSNWCHMVSDTSADELHAFAQLIGLKRAWFQDRLGGKSSADHYDLTLLRRAKAVKLGAVEVTSTELVTRNYDGLTKRGLRK